MGFFHIDHNEGEEANDLFLGFLFIEKRMTKKKQYNNLRVK